MENKFAKGIFFGGLLVVAAVTGFCMSKNGHECTQKLKTAFKPMADSLKEDFDEIVNISVEDYAKKKKISEESKTKIAKLLKSKWSEVKEEFTNGA